MKRTIFGLYLMAYMDSRGVKLDITHDGTKMIGQYEVDEYAQEVRDDFFENEELQAFIESMKKIRGVRHELTN